MPNTYSIKGDTCREDARRKNPILFKKQYLLYMSSKEYDKEVEDYASHIASLRSYPILPGSKWEKTTGLVEGVDFELQKGYSYVSFLPGSDDPIVTKLTVAVPLPPAERQEDMWQSVREDMLLGWTNEELQYKYIITRKS